MSDIHNRNELGKDCWACNCFVSSCDPGLRVRLHSSDILTCLHCGCKRPTRLQMITHHCEALGLGETACVEVAEFVRKKQFEADVETPFYESVYAACENAGMEIDVRRSAADNVVRFIQDLYDRANAAKEQP